MPGCAYVHAPCLFRSPWRLEAASAPLALELHVDVSGHAVLAVEPESSAIATSAPNHRAIAPVPATPFINVFLRCGCLLFWVMILLLHAKPICFPLVKREAMVQLMGLCGSFESQRQQVSLAKMRNTQHCGHNMVLHDRHAHIHSCLPHIHTYFHTHTHTRSHSCPPPHSHMFTLMPTPCTLILTHKLTLLPTHCHTRPSYLHTHVIPPHSHAHPHTPTHKHACLCAVLLHASPPMSVYPAYFRIPSGRSEHCVVCFSTPNKCWLS